MKHVIRRNAERGVSIVEFTFCSLVLIPLLLGTGVVGVNMIKTLSTVQLARDAGHMYANGSNFGLSSYQTILVKLGEGIGLTTTASTSKGVVILSKVVYVDDAQCVLGGAATGGVGNSSCTNKGNWAFVQRVVVGNPSLRSSIYGSPLTSGPTGVTLNPDGSIAASQYVTKLGARATFSNSGFQPYSSVINAGLPSGQVLYLSEAGATGWNMPPFVTNVAPYSWSVF
jgi:hypothetical protein